MQNVVIAFIHFDYVLYSVHTVFSHYVCDYILPWSITSSFTFYALFMQVQLHAAVFKDMLPSSFTCSITCCLYSWHVTLHTVKNPLQSASALRCNLRMHHIVCYMSCYMLQQYITWSWSACPITCYISNMLSTVAAAVASHRLPCWRDKRAHGQQSVFFNWFCWAMFRPGRRVIGPGVRSLSYTGGLVVSGACTAEVALADCNVRSFWNHWEQTTRKLRR
jgi:hypothetical protein